MLHFFKKNVPAQASKAVNSLEDNSSSLDSQDSQSNQSEDDQASSRLHAQLSMQNLRGAADDVKQAANKVVRAAQHAGSCLCELCSEHPGKTVLLTGGSLMAAVLAATQGDAAASTPPIDPKF